MRCFNHNKNKIKVESRELIIEYTCNNSDRLIHVICFLNAGIPSTLYYTVVDSIVIDTKEGTIKIKKITF